MITLYLSKSYVKVGGPFKFLGGPDPRPPQWLPHGYFPSLPSPSPIFSLLPLHAFLLEADSFSSWGYRHRITKNNQLTHLGEMPRVGERFARVCGFSPNKFRCRKLLWECVCAKTIQVYKEVRKLIMQALLWLVYYIYNPRYKGRVAPLTCRIVCKNMHFNMVDWTVFYDNVSRRFSFVYIAD